MTSRKEPNKEEKGAGRLNYQKLLKAVELLYSTSYETNDKVNLMEKQLKEIQSILSQLLSFHKDIKDFESKFLKEK